MNTVETLHLRCLSGVPLLKEDGSPADIVPFDDFKENKNGNRRFNLVDRKGYYKIRGVFCEWLSHNVFLIYYDNDEEIILTVDWKE